ncbi:hypothetical protein [Tortoise microvirus 75]|nr:hypothetical protein [Tortoise microvirus 75]
MKHVHNLDSWYKVPAEKPLVFYGEALRTVEVRVIAIGPCVAYVHRRDGGKPLGEEMLLGYVEGGEETFRFTLEGDFAVRFDAAEVWVYRDQSPVALPPREEPVSFTRHEKAGLYMDELGMALHRQSVLSRLAAKQQRDQESEYTRRLEERLALLGQQIAALTPKPEEPAPEAVSEEPAA